ncbi:response regulator transcription factor [Ferruginibacter paludis]|uniref:response regulator transcription factor n=1 Tax=Ferruginibacter paludis TaxID=1310417 RepID=UPI0025B307AB|nr:response regulator transcription factor [Ferruginibacter paludis]MDN3656683.1 response regulator transcription factor [Ferruginibacter paludis]
MEEIKILLVEDEKKIADTLSKGLRELNYHVATAYDGKIGLRLFDAGNFNLVITDINLPGINGYDLCKIIRSRNQHVPVIMLTALGATNDKIEGFDAGADDYLVKPFEFKELLARIRALLKRTMNQQLPTGNILRVAGLELNVDSMEVTRDGKAITLTAKEFQLLEYFMRNRNRVVTRADIAERVWDLDFDTKTNVIDVYVNFLRKKIDREFEQKLIQTQVGTGYIMKDK